MEDKSNRNTANNSQPHGMAEVMRRNLNILLERRA